MWEEVLGKVKKVAEHEPRKKANNQYSFMGSASVHASKFLTWLFLMMGYVWDV